MTKAKKRVAVNLGALIGIAVTLFVVPPDTTFWVWALEAITAMVALNLALVLWRDPALSPLNNGIRDSLLSVLLFVVVMLLTLWVQHR